MWIVMCLLFAARQTQTEYTRQKQQQQQQSMPLNQLAFRLNLHLASCHSNSTLLAFSIRIANHNIGSIALNWTILRSPSDLNGQQSRMEMSQAFQRFVAKRLRASWYIILLISSEQTITHEVTLVCLLTS